MKVKIRKPMSYSDGSQKLLDIQPYELVINEKCIMSIDGSTSNSGVAILRQSDGALMYSMAFSRESKEEPVRYKVQFKSILVQLFRRCKDIVYVYYEEPIIEYASAVGNLMMLRTIIDEIKIENEPEFNYIGNSEVNNKKWKKAFLEPAKLPNNTELEKKMVRDKLTEYIPCLVDATQDEIDATAMGFAALMMFIQTGDDKGLQSKKKAKPFQYNAYFVGAEECDDALDTFMSSRSVPKELIGSGLGITKLGAREDFDQHIYRNMGDDDKILVIEFNSDKHGDIILRHRLGEISMLNSKIYAFVWRKNRKR